MCSITGSKDLKKLKELIELNSYRGVHSHSITVFDPGGVVDTMFIPFDILYQKKGLGPLIFDDHDLSEYKDAYYIVHQQAPTTESKNSNAIHPAIHNDNMLWHNGIIKHKQVESLQDKFTTKCNWDTMLLLKHLNEYDTPNDIDGTFSCVLYDGDQLSIFRNEISPLFYDSELNISSTKFENSKRLEPNKMFLMSVPNNTLVKYNEFKTVENPYYFS